MLLAFLCAQAWAGVLVVDTAVPVELRLEGTSVLRSFGPLSAEVDLAAGPATVELVRDGKKQDVDLTLPVQGGVRMTVKADSVKTDPAPPTAETAGALELHAAEGQTFSLVMDGDREVVFGARFPVTLAALTPGEHALELRSADLTLVWGRGSVVVKPGDHLVLNANQGYGMEVSGRDGAWVPSKDDGPPAPQATTPADDQQLPEVNSPDVLGR